MLNKISLSLVNRLVAKSPNEDVEISFKRKTIYKLAMKNSLYIERKNIPLILRDLQFCISKIEKKDTSVILHYIMDGKGPSIYHSNKVDFDDFPNKVTILSGGWYGDVGRWSPLLRCEGSIICENVSSMNKVSDKGTNYKFIVTKSFFSSKRKLYIESEEVGIIELKCGRIVPQPYQSFVFDKLVNKWIDALTWIKANPSNSKFP